MIVKTYHGDRELNDKVAEIIGIKIGEHQYRPMTEGMETIFTAPPQFDVSEWAVDKLVEFAKEHGVEIKTRKPREVCLELVEKFKRGEEQADV